MIDTYLEQLSACLQRYGVESSRIGDIVAEVESHLRESGEEPLAAFGPAEVYAEERVAAYEQSAGGEWQRRTFRATAFDEMAILQEAGKAGWELSDVAALALYCQRPWDRKKIQQWEYARRIGLNRNVIIAEMIAENWEPCGNWTPFHYFKRPIKPQPEEQIEDR
ncbi:hypothetical protein EPA93_00170 [Ktedonosporobacter rubrisoli]|uniref:Uncharacterized protein n=1 Tax=Ktedonosporobacter rubrisoli TaxID=2509675 RepID=A0A4P6JHW2_KTERU|nr:hypothetical protein [Ktedonosporobacter rubrisoli]QBD74492.1 hypothetical protein EPA93_00170 [Ktedonosporobacter rubrisoli]